MTTQNLTTLSERAGRVASELAASVARADDVGLQYVALGAAGPELSLTFGVRDAATGEPVDARTTFLSASSTKVLTAAAVLVLWQRGALQLDDPLARYLPYQPYGARVTLQQLLDHSAGVPSPLPLRWVHLAAAHARYDEAARLRELLARHPRLAFEPGARYAYSNLSYWLLGRVIEAVAQTDYASFLQQSIAAPLELAASELGVDPIDPGRAARGHARRWSALGLALPLLAGRQILARPAGSWLRFEHLYMDGPAYGGVRATAQAYARFLQDLLAPRSRVLSDASRQLFFAPRHTSGGARLPTTLGWHVGALAGEPYFEKPGGGPGFSSNLRLYPGRKLGTVLLSNRMRVSEAEIRHFTDRVDRALLCDCCSHQRQVGARPGDSVCC